MAVHSKLKAALLAGSALAGMALTSVTAQAGGFAVREQSAYFQGTSFAGAAAGGPSISSMFWNPATMTGAAPGLTTESAYTGIIGDSVITPTAAAHPAAPGLLGFGDSGNISEKALVPASYIVWRPSEQWALGIATGAPFGLVTNPRALWAGMFYSRESEVITYNATPMAAYKVNNWLSVGAGLQVQYMRVRLDQAFPGSGTFPPFGPLAPDTLSINANGISVGFTAGVTLTPTPWTTIGIGYRSGINQYLEGNALRPAFVASVVPFPVIVPAGGATIVAHLPLPDTVSLGIRQKVTESFTLLGTVEWANWSRFDAVPITLVPNPAPPGIPTALPFGWQDGWFASIGAEYQFNPALALRAGIGFERSPITDAVRATRLPDNDRIWASAGVSYAWSEKLSIDLGYTHIFVDDAPINLSPGSGNPSFNPALGTFIGTARTDVDIISLGIRYRFGDFPLKPLVTKG